VETGVIGYTLWMLDNTPNGACVATLLSSPQPSGLCNLHWDGRNRVGQVVPFGVYLVRADVQGQSQGRFVESRKLVWIRQGLHEALRRGHRGVPRLGSSMDEWSRQRYRGRPEDGE
jgi:hypothetical protein